MKGYISTLLIAIGLAGTLAITGCKSEKVGEKIQEGVIIYEVSFPYNKDDILIHLYPSEFILEFKGDKLHGYLASVGGVVSTEIIADGNTQTFHHMLKSFNDRITCSLDKPQLDEVIGAMPGLDFVGTSNKATVAGYECNRTIAQFQMDSVPPIELLYTDELNIKNPNWYTQFAEVDGVLLGYEIEQYGMRMKLRAKEIRFEEIDDSVFEVSRLYKEVDWATLESKLKTLITEGV